MAKDGIGFEFEFTYGKIGLSILVLCFSNVSQFIRFSLFSFFNCIFVGSGILISVRSKLCEEHLLHDYAFTNLGWMQCHSEHDFVFF